MGNSKSIGNNYERQFSYELSEWITGEPDTSICWRDKSSGARHTVRNKTGKETSGSGGDIYPTDSRYEWWFTKFFIDTKSYKEFNPLFINPNNQKTNEILKQWIKTICQCPSNKIPIMPSNIRDRKTPDIIFFPQGISYKSNGYISNQIILQTELKIPISKKNSIYLKPGEEFKFTYCLKSEFFELNNYKCFADNNMDYTNPYAKLLQTRDLFNG